MKKLLAVATALSGLLAFAGSASAADVTVDPGYDWTGPYIGIQGGYGWETNNYTYTLGAVNNDTDIDMNGFVGGGTIGANWQHESFVFGLEGDVSFADIQPCVIRGCGYLWLYAHASIPKSGMMSAYISYINKAMNP